MASDPAAKKLSLPFRLAGAALRPALNALLERALWSRDRHGGEELFPKIQRLLSWGADPNMDMNGGWTPLGFCAFAAGEASPTLAALFLEAGADPNRMCRNGHRPLTAGVEFDDLNFCVALMRAGADPEARTKGGRTAFDIAKGRGSGSTGPIRPPSPEESERARQRDEAMLAALARGLLEREVAPAAKSGSDRKARL